MIDNKALEAKVQKLEKALEQHARAIETLITNYATLVEYLKPVDHIDFNAARPQIKLDKSQLLDIAQS